MLAYGDWGKGLGGGGGGGGVRGSVYRNDADFYQSTIFCLF